jgi:hypothetical protein
MREYRVRQKAIATGEEQNKSKGKPNSKPKIRSADKDLELEQEPDKNIDTDSDIDLNSEVNPDHKNTVSINPDFIVKTFHDICKTLPKVTKLTAERRAAIYTAHETLQANGVTFEQFFAKIESSDFFKGLVKDWKATFDWVMRTENINKILSGKYDSREPKATADFSDQSRYKNLTMGGDK